MTRRLVIPADAQAGDVAYTHRPETWQELADEAGVELAVLGDQWCIDNQVNGLGIASEYVAPPDPPDPVPQLVDVASSRRPANDRTASRSALIAKTDKVRARRADLRAALKALPAPASRTNAQKRDALVLNTLIDLVAMSIAAVGLDNAADRDTTEDEA